MTTCMHTTDTDHAIEGDVAVHDHDVAPTMKGTLSWTLALMTHDGREWPLDKAVNDVISYLRLMMQ